MKCIHPKCNFEGIKGLCSGHRELILKESNSVLICNNCGQFLKVFEKPDESIPKYVFSTGCRFCSKETDEKIITKKEE